MSQVAELLVLSMGGGQARRMLEAVAARGPLHAVQQSMQYSGLATVCQAGYCSEQCVSGGVNLLVTAAPLCAAVAKATIFGFSQHFEVLLDTCAIHTFLLDTCAIHTFLHTSCPILAYIHSCPILICELIHLAVWCSSPMCTAQQRICAARPTLFN